MLKEIIKIQEPPKLAIQFANTIFILGILFSILIASYSVYRIRYRYGIDVGLLFYYTSIPCSGISAALFGLGLRLRSTLKINLSLLFVTLGISVYTFETYLEFSNLEFSKVLRQTKTPIEVLEDLNNSGHVAYPNIEPKQLISTNGLPTTKGKIFPFGGISNITTILSNESGYYPIIKTDEHGFNNPKGLYKKDRVDIMLSGDSFAEGYSVNQDENIAAVLRESGFNTISIGKGGNGPLLELALLKEYAEPLQPKIILWLYYENDIDDLGSEMNSSFRRQYLNNDDFSQNLISRQDEIDRVLIKYAQKEWKKEKIKVKKKKIIKTTKILKLHNLRSKINLLPNSIPLQSATKKQNKRELALVDFKKILEKSKKMISTWGGKMYFVFLPPYHMYTLENEYFMYSVENDFIFSLKKGYSNREEVLLTVTKLNIPIIDIHKEVFEHHSDPLSLFPFRKFHYNAKGYRLVAEAISKTLKDDGLVPSESQN